MNRKILNSWAIPLLVQIILCMAFSLITFVIDKHLDGQWINEHIFRKFFSNDAGTIANVLGGLTQVAPAILGITITVIAIVVEMASNKYSPKVMDLFVNDKLNFWVMALFVVCSVNSIWVAHILTSSFFPIVSIILNAFLVSISLLIVIPYFNHIFTFLHPHNFIAYVEDGAIKNLEKLKNPSMTNEEVHRIKNSIVESIEFVGDIAINSVIQGDRAVSQYCSNILTDLFIAYLDIKKDLPESFFVLTDVEREDADFIDFSEFVQDIITTRKIWLERKIFRLMEIIFTISRENLKTVASGVLLNSTKIGEKASKLQNKEVIFTVIQYFNTFLRFAINSSDPRTAFNILEHYRNFGEILMFNMPEEVERVTFYFKYYALEAQKRHVLFILETAAHDICKLNELAFELNISCQDRLLDMFLKLDQSPEESSGGPLTQQELSLIGVRIAQVKLAAFYIMKERCDLARKIFDDMKDEPLNRIRIIQDLIEMNTDEEYWEITGRGINFFFVSENRKVALTEFFSWYDKPAAEV